MLFGLCCLVAFALCVVFWGTVVMLCLQNWFFFKAGLLALVGIILLTFVVAAAYWIIEQLRCRAKLRSEITVAIAKQDMEEQKRLEKRLGEETLNVAIGMSLVILLHIVVYGIAAPIWLAVDSYYWLKR